MEKTSFQNPNRTAVFTPLWGSRQSDQGAWHPQIGEDAEARSRRSPRGGTVPGGPDGADEREQKAWSAGG